MDMGVISVQVLEKQKAGNAKGGPASGDKHRAQ